MHHAYKHFIHRRAVLAGRKWVFTEVNACWRYLAVTVAA